MNSIVNAIVSFDQDRRIAHMSDAFLTVYFSYILSIQPIPHRQLATLTAQAASSRQYRFDELFRNGDSKVLAQVCTSVFFLRPEVGFIESAIDQTLDHVVMDDDAKARLDTVLGAFKHDIPDTRTRIFCKSTSPIGRLSYLSAISARLIANFGVPFVTLFGKLTVADDIFSKVSLATIAKELCPAIQTVLDSKAVVPLFNQVTSMITQDHAALITKYSQLLAKYKAKKSELREAEETISELENKLDELLKNKESESSKTDQLQKYLVKIRRKIVDLMREQAKYRAFLDSRRFAITTDIDIEMMRLCHGYEPSDKKLGMNSLAAIISKDRKERAVASLRSAESTLNSLEKVDQGLSKKRGIIAKEESGQIYKKVQALLLKAQKLEEIAQEELQKSR